MSNHPFRTAVGSVVLLMLCAGVAAAQPPGGFGGFRGGGGFDPAAFAQSRFESGDLNHDGKLSMDECSDRTRSNFTTIDKNGDGFLDLEEYKGYVQERMSSFSAGRGGPPGAPPTTPGGPSSSVGGPPSFGNPPGGFDPNAFRGKDGRDSRDWGGSRDRGDDRSSRRPDDRGGSSTSVPKSTPIVRPTAIRYGKLPDDLPEWFKELDTDHDGQVGLYEWRKGDRETTEFLAIDLNGDGLLTADEYLRSQKWAEEQKQLDELVAAAGGPGSSAVETSSTGTSSRSSDKSYKSSSSRDNPFARKK